MNKCTCYGCREVEECYDFVEVFAFGAVRKLGDHKFRPVENTYCPVCHSCADVYMRRDAYVGHLSWINGGRG